MVGSVSQNTPFILSPHSRPRLVLFWRYFVLLNDQSVAELKRLPKQFQDSDVSLPTRADPPTCQIRHPCCLSEALCVVVICTQAATDDDWIEDTEIAAGDEDILDDCHDDTDFCQRCEHKQLMLTYSRRVEETKTTSKLA